MSTWPAGVKFPKARELMLRLDPDNEEQWVLQDSSWPPLDIQSPLPLLVIKVCAVAIHRDELVLTEEERADKDFHRNPGYEFSGYVVSASPQSPLRPGTEVYGRTSFRRSGNARTYTAVKYQELGAKPTNTTWAEAATIPLGGLVAYQALFTSGLLREPGAADWGRKKWPLGWNQGVDLLITAAHTPAGIWAIQLAKLAGVGRIAVTCNVGSEDLMRSLGACEVYPWTESGSLKEWTGSRYSAILDLMGGVTLRRAWRLITEKGKILSVVDNVEDAKPEAVSRGVQICMFTLFNSTDHLDTLASLVEKDKLRPVCDPADVFDLEKADEALEKLIDHPRGQVVLTFDTDFPMHEIETLKTRGDEWGIEDFCVSKMDEASEKDSDEGKFKLVRWLQTVGSNHPALAELTERELMPPPHLMQARSRPRVQIVSFNGQIPNIQRHGMTQD